MIEKAIIGLIGITFTGIFLYGFVSAYLEHKRHVFRELTNDAFGRTQGVWEYLREKHGFLVEDFDMLVDACMRDDGRLIPAKLYSIKYDKHWVFTLFLEFPNHGWLYRKFNNPGDLRPCLALLQSKDAFRPITVEDLKNMHFLRVPQK